MQVKEAVAAAKQFATSLLADEGMFNLGLEEIEFVSDQDAWDITVGFSRPWNSSRGALSALTGEDLSKRAYRVVRIRNSDGQVVWMKRRESLE